MADTVVLLYTTIGGVIGGGLTQYVTHIRDRRAARALVVERLIEVEEAYADLRRPLLKGAPPRGPSRLARPLGSLEAAGLIAGIPRAILMCYIAVCKYYEDAQFISQGTVSLANQVGTVVSDNVDSIRERGNPENVIKSLRSIAEHTKKVHTQVKEIDDPAFRLHDEALEELSRTLWHPLALQFRRRKLHDLQERADKLEKLSRNLATLLRQISVSYQQLAPRNPTEDGNPAPTNEERGSQRSDTQSIASTDPGHLPDRR